MKKPPLTGWLFFADKYLGDQAPGKFLAEFAGQSNGQVFKARSEANLVPVFQSVASKMQYYYVATYQFPPTGTLSVDPATLTIDEIRTMGATSFQSILLLPKKL